MYGDDKDFERQLKDDFLIEAAELLADTETLFLQLEKDPSNSQIIDKIFRIVHTIKGSGAVAGFKELAAFSHVFETLLGKLRTKEVAVSNEIIDIMLAGVDVLNQFVMVLRRDHAATVDARSVLSRIEAKIAAPSSPVPSVTVERKAASREESIPARMVDLTDRSRSILVVDSDPVALSKIVDMISSLGSNIQTAFCGGDAITILERNPKIDLLIIEQRLPDMQGSEVVQYVRQQKREIPVIVVSGTMNQVDETVLIRLGIFDFCEKPLSKEKILLAARNALRANEFRSTMGELSKLTIRSYMTFRKILENIETEKSGPASAAIHKYSAFLEEMGAFINRAMHSSENVAEEAIEG